MLTIMEAANLLGLSAQRIYQLVARGELGAHRRGKMWFITNEAIIAYARSRAQSARAESERWEQIADTLTDVGNVSATRATTT